MMMCGVDEAGRGPMMGPLVVGAVWTEDDSVLRNIGVKDSKQLSPAQREIMFSEISDTAAHWEVVIVSAEELDRRMAEKNLNEVEMGMFAEAIMKHPSDIVYIDCPETNTQRFGAIMSNLTGGRRVDAENKADALFPTVSAASIMAKVTRDRLIEDIAREFGCDIGSGYPSDPVTKAFVEKWIKDNGSPPPHTRRSWKPVKDMMSKRFTSSLDNW
ncbi:ribonuclease H, mammalian HI/archaeal HII subfamily [Thermoplasmatales archaeon BRNA1]|nr:ribonuclease H, mammalian HI/archaeal HII subfamily [Thermoplasmatales archaeon BRNA1]